MDLTGKAKYDFILWNAKNNYIVSELAITQELLHESVINALIIEWLDSVEIYINTPMTHVTDCFVIEINNSVYEEEYSSRQKATKQAIIKANQIYNENN